MNKLWWLIPVVIGLYGLWQWGRWYESRYMDRLVQEAIEDGLVTYYFIDPEVKNFDELGNTGLVLGELKAGWCYPRIEE